MKRLLTFLFTLIFGHAFAWAQSNVALNPPTADELDLFNMTESEQQISLNVSLRGVTRQTAFLYGGLSAPFGPLRTVLLRTTDGGKNWKEVSMTPEGSSYISYLDFPSAQVGYAVTLFGMEGPGEVKLFKTTDGGKTWRYVRTFPKSVHYDVPLGFKMGSVRGGSLYMTCQEKGENYVMRFTTRDGGRTWLKSRCTPDTQVKIPADPGLQPTADHYFWEMESPDGDVSETQVFRYFFAEQQKPTVASIPRHWKAANKKWVKQ